MSSLLEENIHLILGIGTSSIFCVHELLRKKDEKKYQILLFDLGEVINQQTNPITSQSLNWGTAFSSGKNIRNYLTLSQIQLYFRSICYCFCESIGGSSNINAMIWTGGHSQVFDRYWPNKWNSQRFSL